MPMGRWRVFPALMGRSSRQSDNCPRRPFGTGRAWRAVAVGAVAVAAGVVAIDVVPRQVVGDRQVTVCGLEGLAVRIAPAPIPWQLVTGGLRAQVLIPPEAVNGLLERRLEGTSLVEPQVTLLDDTVKVNGLVEAPVGRVPVEILLDLAVDEGGVTLEFREVLIAGRDVSARSSGLLPWAGRPGGSDPLCQTANEAARVKGADVSPGGIVLTVAW